MIIFVLIVAATGRQSNSGYTVSVTSFKDFARFLKVAVMETAPGKECTATESSRNPIALVLIPQSINPIKFGISKTSSDCVGQVGGDISALPSNATGHP